MEEGFATQWYCFRSFKCLFTVRLEIEIIWGYAKFYAFYFIY